jgi:hypothetical protein
MLRMQPSTGQGPHRGDKMREKHIDAFRSLVEQFPQLWAARRRTMNRMEEFKTQTW